MPQEERTNQSTNASQEEKSLRKHRTKPETQDIWLLHAMSFSQKMVFEPWGSKPVPIWRVMFLMLSLSKRPNRNGWGVVSFGEGSSDHRWITSP
jgi:hypothetical protein